MNDMANADMSEFWNGDGGEKWVRFQERMDAGLIPFGNKAMAVAEVSPGEVVIDVGCGCGDTTLELARRAGPQGRVLGVDISKPILARAQARLDVAAEQNITFEQGDAQIHRFAPATADVVFSRFGIMFFDDPAAAFGNLRRGMKPGGRVTFICWRPAQDNEWIGLSLGVVAKHVPLPLPPGPEDPGPMSFGDPDRVRRVLTSAGLSDIAIERSNMPFRIGGNRTEAVEFLTQLGPAGGAIAQANTDDGTKTRIAADMREALAPYDTGQGVVIGAATWIVTARNP